MPFNLYVINLRREILEEKPKFRKENPNHRSDKPCVYVGSTAHTPEERYAQHKDPDNDLSNPYACEYGEGLRERHPSPGEPYETRDEAVENEVRLAERLKRKGYAVWQR